MANSTKFSVEDCVSYASLKAELLYEQYKKDEVKT